MIILTPKEKELIDYIKKIISNNLNKREINLCLICYHLGRSEILNEDIIKIKKEIQSK
jgi:hypothetical protein